MHIIQQGEKTVGILDDAWMLHTNDSALAQLYRGWQMSGIPVLTPVVSPAGIYADGTEMVKPSAATAGVVCYALEREGYIVE